MKPLSVKFGKEDQVLKRRLERASQKTHRGKAEIARAALEEFFAKHPTDEAVISALIVRQTGLCITKA